MKLQTFQWVFCARAINIQRKEVFQKYRERVIARFKFLGGLYNFCNFVFIFSLIVFLSHVDM